MFLNLFFYKCFSFSFHHSSYSWFWALKNNVGNRSLFKEFLEKYFSSAHRLLQLFLLHKSWFKNWLWLFLDNRLRFNLHFFLWIWNNNNLWYWFVVEVMVFFRKFSVASNSSSNSLLLCSCSNIIIFSVIVTHEASNFT